MVDVPKTFALCFDQDKKFRLHSLAFDNVKNHSDWCIRFSVWKAPQKWCLVQFLGGIYRLLIVAAKNGFKKRHHRNLRPSPKFGRNGKSAVDSGELQVVHHAKCENFWLPNRLLFAAKSCSTKGFDGLKQIDSIFCCVFMTPEYRWRSFVGSIQEKLPVVKEKLEPCSEKESFLIKFPFHPFQILFWSVSFLFSAKSLNLWGFGGTRIKSCHFYTAQSYCTIPEEDEKRRPESYGKLAVIYSRRGPETIRRRQ